MAGLNAVPYGKDKFGIFPLRGKLLNVREATAAQLLKNTEIESIIKIVGLVIGKNYTDAKSLRYGAIMIMTDQDVDGFHIKGLLLNFIEKLWPSLLQVPGFVTEFITPVVRCRKGATLKDFYNLPSFERWWRAEQAAGRGKSWRIKYYKGLGTSDNQEAKEYFGALQQHKKTFVIPEPTEAKELLSLPFAKERSDDRKAWIRAHDPTATQTVSLRHNTIHLKDFIDHHLRLFSIADCDRSIPSVMDGFKTSQRKILFACLKRNLKNELQVAQLSGYVTEHSAYHHGETSVQQTIVSMAQTFVFAGNLNLLHPGGQFGTREEGGKDAASARYIATHLTPIVSALFHPLDAPLLTYKTEDDMKVEPFHYLPVIPFVLVNGINGIGTGFSATIPGHHPLDVSANTRRALINQPLQPMTPWYRGFRGTIEKDPKETFRYHVRGIWERTKTGVIVRELPYRTWVTKYKEHLEKALESTTKSGLHIEDYQKLSGLKTEHDIAIAIESKQLVGETDDAAIAKFLKLNNCLKTNNMNAFDADGRICRFNTACDIIKYYVPFRLKAYGERKTVMLEALDAAMLRIRNVWRFLGEICKGTFKFARRAKADMEAELVRKKYTKIQDNYDYLLRKPFYAASTEKLKALEAKLKAKQEERDALAKQLPKQLWLADLDAFDKAWGQHYEKWQQASILKTPTKPTTTSRKRKRSSTHKKPTAKHRKKL
jgi:DNA topoisomerase-2